MNALTLSDARTGNTDDSYTGEVSDSPVSADYVRNKIREFQAVLNALDESYQAGLAAWHADGQSDAELDRLLRDYESQSVGMKATAEALNLGAELSNAVGVRMPVLSIPQTLGLAPAGLLLPAAVVAALAAVAGWVTYSIGYSAAMTEAIAVVHGRLGNTEAAREIERQLQRAKDAQTRINLPDLSQIAGGVKLLAVVALGFLAWRAFGGMIDRQQGDR